MYFKKFSFASKTIFSLDANNFFFSQLELANNFFYEKSNTSPPPIKNNGPSLKSMDSVRLLNYDGKPFNIVSQEVLDYYEKL